MCEIKSRGSMPTIRNAKKADMKKATEIIILEKLIPNNNIKTSNY